MVAWRLGRKALLVANAHSFDAWDRHLNIVIERSRKTMIALHHGGSVGFVCIAM